MNYFQGVVLLYLGTLSICDIRKKQITFGALLLGGFMVILSFFLESNLAWQDRLFGACMGLVLYVVSSVTKEAIGKGDSILITLLGLSMGFFQCSKVVLCGLFLCSVVCIGALCLKKVSKRQRIAFIPFLFVGYVICL